MSFWGIIPLPESDLETNSEYDQETDIETLENYCDIFLDYSDGIPQAERVARLEELITERLRVQIAIQNIRIMLLLCLETLTNHNLYRLHAQELLKIYFGSHESVKSAIIARLTGMYIQNCSDNPLIFSSAVRICYARALRRRHEKIKMAEA